MARSSESGDSGFSNMVTIQEYAARKDKFRVVAYGVPLAFPIYKIAPDEELDALADKLEAQVIEILSSFEIKVDNILLRLWQPGYPGHRATKNVFHISTKDEETVNWQAAAKAVYSLFITNGVSSLQLNHPLQVEISNPGLCYHDISRPLPDDAELLEYFETKKDPITEIVLADLHGVVSVICFHCRVPFSKRFIDCEGKATIIIFCRPEISGNFQSAEDRVTELFQDATIDVYVELLPGDLESSVNANMGLPVFYDFVKDPENGSSISVKGRKKAVSIGGWLYLHCHSRLPIKCFLTCYHVIKSTDPEIVEITDRNGVTLDGGLGHVEIEKQEGQEIDKESEASWTKAIQRGSIGRVLCASGYGLLGRHRLDWALVEGSETFAHNKPPAKVDMDRPLFKPNPNVTWKTNPDFQARDFASVKKEGWVGFRGRTSGSTDLLGGGRLDFGRVEIIPLKGATFNFPGDSGSMIFNSTGQILGLNMTRNNDCGYMIAMDTIQQDVEKKTGGFLSLSP
ncbi:hypothetical protein AJ79_02052 [Helicocarpus griseus UAMH5409]|uniref:Serine protease n=1 Tax=Helicocarpus griseus UAMH5409 TaxID=1447875 RepID=A0A2B7Y5B4_9EURO|nr:hypothetical protein AJ79_02052 [Helicocarpus griseus UAMH5409]